MDDKLLQHLMEKNLKELIDKCKVQILNKLIELSEKRQQGILLKEELMVIKSGVEEARNKSKDEEIKSIVSVIDNLVGRFGQEEDFEDKVGKVIESNDAINSKEGGK